MTAGQLARLLGRAVDSVRTEPLAYASSHPVDLVTVRFPDAAEVRLVVKDPGRLLPGARGAKPAFLHDPRRELDVYANVLPGMSLGSPRFVGELEGLLVLEYVDGVPLTEVGDLEVWKHAVGCAAAMHLRLRRHGGSRLPRNDLARYAGWFERARRFQGRRMDELASPYQTAVERVLQLPATIVHGELYPSNVLIGAGNRVCPLDWENAALGTGLLDLAALTSGRFSEEQRRLLVAAYAEHLGICDLAALLVDVCRCRLLLAVQWLGWSSEWEPPPSQRHDWLGEARVAAEALA